MFAQSHAVLEWHMMATWFSYPVTAHVSLLTVQSLITLLRAIRALHTHKSIIRSLRYCFLYLFCLFRLVCIFGCVVFRCCCCLFAVFVVVVVVVVCCCFVVVLFVCLFLSLFTCLFSSSCWGCLFLFVCFLGCFPVLLSRPTCWAVR